MPGGCSATPAVVNPGAFEYLGDGVDNDCDPSTLDLPAVAPDCSPAPLQAPTTADVLVKALDLCLTTTESPPLPMKKWGVISSSLTLADGTGAPKDVQVGVLSKFGPYVLPTSPHGGTSFAALSSGTARALGDPGYVHPKNDPNNLANKGSFDAMTSVSAPPSYLAAHGGQLPSTCGPACAGCATANDSVNLKIRIRVPTNAKSFSYRLKFYSAEYWEYLCQTYNDFFVTLLTSSWVPDPNAVPAEVPLPADGNIAFDSMKNPVSVNNALFQVCFPHGAAPCPSGTLGLVGNGMGGWGTNPPEVDEGGGTDWLTNQAPAVPGETIDIQFVIWDSGDHFVDSLVLLDQWRWDVKPAAVSTHQ